MRTGTVDVEHKSRLAGTGCFQLDRFKERVIKIREPMHVVPLNKEMERRIREDFLAYIKDLYSWTTWRCDDIEICYINIYKNGVAMFIKKPALIAHDGIIPITIGGQLFYEAHPAMVFYAFETSTFVIVHRNNESELLSLLSQEELRDLSMYSKTHWRDAGAN